MGDGTTSVVIVAAELLKRANELVRQRIHPTSIISGYRMAMREARPSPLISHACWHACRLRIGWHTHLLHALPDNCHASSVYGSVHARRCWGGGQGHACIGCSLGCHSWA